MFTGSEIAHAPLSSFHESIISVHTLHVFSTRTPSCPASDLSGEGPIWHARQQNPQYSTSAQLLHLFQTLESGVRTPYFILLREESKPPQNPPPALPTVLKGALQVPSQLLRGQRLGCRQQEVQHRPMRLSHVINDIGLPRLYFYRPSVSKRCTRSLRRRMMERRG